MARPHLRWVLLILLLLITSLFFLLPETFTSPYYDKLQSQLPSHLDLPSYFYSPSSSKPSIGIATSTLPGRASSKDFVDLSKPKPKAKFVILAREIELNELLWSLKSLEESFNNKSHAHYDYIFLNNGVFSNHFKKMITKTVSSKVDFDVVPESDWAIPEHIDMKLAKEKWADLVKAKVPYADSESYRQMCRFQSGKFFDQPLLDGLDYYWRVEPGVRFYCDIEGFDPFRYMAQYKKKYGWVLALREYPSTIRTLWPWVKQFTEANPELYLPREESSAKFILSDDGIGYNRCHYWTNFEIADLSVWRSKGYRKLFEFLDLKGGFFYSRWGDAPVHTIGASFLLRPSEIVQFDNVGYYHPPFSKCDRFSASNKCRCDPRSSFDYDRTGFSCQREYDAMNGLNSTEIVMDYKKSIAPEVVSPEGADWLVL